jgi:hypothetical protein
MADTEHEIALEETPIQKVEINPSTLTPTSPEVISKYDTTLAPLT